MSFPRLSGILLHPISLPSRGGIGDFGPAAYEFVDFLAEAGQGLWQVLPLGPPALGTSPYSSTSAFAGNPLLISLERLAENGWLDKKRLEVVPQDVKKIDYDAVANLKFPLLTEAARNFLARPSPKYQKFCSENEWWLEDFVLFDALRQQYGKQSWMHWPSGLARRNPEALKQARSELREQLDIERVIQFFFFDQWWDLRSYCSARSIRVVGDIAIFVDYDSADVWANRGSFRIGEDLCPTVVSGVPPDVFSASGQRWGNPLYNWEAMRANGYEWWTRRLRWATQTCDYIRLDHFRGFAQFWEIPASDSTAINGKWVDGPGDDLFNQLKQSLGSLPFFAEDLGVITPDVTALRERHKIPGMAVLQFGFGNPDAHIYLPHRLTCNHVVYTGTHDNDTSLGWWNSLSEKERRAVESLTGRCNDGVNWSLIRLAQSSVAAFAVAPLQDVLGLGSEARLNTPSTTDGNYHWRYQSASLTANLAQRLHDLAQVCDRLPAAVS